MAKYRVWFTVKDSYGNTKEVAGGTIDLDVGLTDLTQREIDCLEEALPLEDYVTRKDLDVELDDYATDNEVVEAFQNNSSIRYSDFELKED